MLKATALVLVAAQIAGIASSVHAIVHSRTPQGAIGWVIALNTIPVVSLPAYWLVGRSQFDDHLTAHRRGRKRVTPVTETLVDEIESYRIMDGPNVPAIETAENLATVPTLRNNSTRLLVNGAETFENIFDGLDQAEEYILQQWFIVRDDQLGRRMQAKLIEKSREGVDVYFIYDAFGSIDLPNRFVKELEDAGVEVQAFRTDDGILERFQFNFRNHRKITVVDGKIAWIGGHNLGDEYMGRHPRLSPWHDAHVRIEGPAALVPQLAFVRDWAFLTEKIPPLNWQPVSSTDGDEPVLVVASGPPDDLEAVQLMYVNAINSAQERIWIASPYFVPDRAVIAALQLAGLRGVDVRILIPKLHDHLLVKLAAYSYFEEAGMTGVNFYWYRDGFMHRKAMLIDDMAAAIGSANFDNRSFRLNFEITGLFLSQTMIESVERMFLEDFEHSERIDAEILETRPFWFRLGVHAARLAAPLL